ncbi:hypothetical protein ABE494_11720 [Stenotrophomonas lactitubi]|uniref:hypothetical protein n=1 Tax=Stenotrophomonas lactitubi TaxID=2045214 RepID=UPI00320AE105
MRLCFEPRPYSSFDPVSGITIPRPRVLPGELADGTVVTEYQYAFYHGDKRVGGLGFHGTDQLAEINGHTERVFTFDLGHDWLITYMLEFKTMVGNSDTDFSFLRDLAQGLAMAYAGQTDNVEDLRYVAITTVSALAIAGVLTPDRGLVASDSHVVLAEAYVPVNAH